jgi:drug/metabolite transporter (DMT)-like permease
MRETFCSFSLVPAAKNWLWKKVELSAIVAPSGHASLIWAALFSLLIFAEPPSLNTIFGARMIAVSGVFIYIRKKETI